jgi:tetratricopeptide (TPR) repeat protein
LFGRVHAFVKLNRLDQAQEELALLRDHLRRRNLDASSAMVGFHLLQAGLLQALGNYEPALAACDSAMEYGTELVRTEVYHQMAQLYLAMGNREAAFDALDEALRYNPNNPHVLLTLARVYNAAGDQQMTREIGNRVLELWKDADRDFQPLAELKQLLSLRAPGHQP